MEKRKLVSVNFNSVAANNQLLLGSPPAGIERKLRTSLTTLIDKSVKKTMIETKVIEAKLRL